jgi:hypothetical protein
VNFTIRPAHNGGAKAEAQINLDFKGFWGVLAKCDTSAKNTESKGNNFCAVWLCLKDEARTNADNNTINAVNNP